MQGSTQDSNWDASGGGIAAGVKYSMEIEYDGTYVFCRVAGALRITTVPAFGTDFGVYIPDEFYAGSTQNGIAQGDGVFSAP